MNNAGTGQESALTIFGGLVAEVNPTELPQGVAAICCDMDFTVGSVKTRYGISEVYSSSEAFEEVNAQVGLTLEGIAPDETPWITPLNLTLDTIPDYAHVTLNTPGSSPVPGTSIFDKGASSTGFGIDITTPAQVPTNPYELAITAVAWGSAGGGHIANYVPTAPYTLTSASNAVLGQTTYAGSFSPPLPAGVSVFVGGFVNNGNNSGLFAYPLAFAVISCTPTEIVLANPGGVAETHAGQLYLQWAVVNYSAGEPLGGRPYVYTLGLQNSISGLAQLYLGGSQSWQAWTGLFTNGNRPTILVETQFIFTTPVPSAQVISDPIAISGSTMVVVMASSQASSSGVNTSAPTIADNLGNTYVNVYWYSGGTSGALGIWVAEGITGGNLVATMTAGDANNIAAEGVTGYEIVGESGPGAGTSGISQILQASSYPLAIPPADHIVGFQAEVFGHQTSGSADATLTLSLIMPAPTSPTYTFQLPLVDGEIVLGTPTTNWGLSLTPALLNNPAFGFNIQAQAPGGEEVTFNIYAVKIKVWLGAGVDEFTYIKTFEMENETPSGFGQGGLFTIALDTNGIFWQEDVLNLPNVLVEFYSPILPDTFAQSVTYDDREWIALSDLINGTDMPRQYNGQWVDRVSQCAPGAPPSVSATTQTYPIISITQPPPVISQIGGPGISALLWSAGPGNNHQAGNVITIYYGTPGAHAAVTPPDPNIIVGDAVVLASWSNIPSGASPNGTYIVNSISTTAGFGGQIYNTFTVTAPSVQLADLDGIDNPAPDGTYESSLATLTTSQPIPNVQVGSQIAVSGASVPAWDATWTILYTPNAAQLEVTATSLAGNVATYDYTLITGTAPTVGQQVTVTFTNNGNGIFNVVDAIISAVAPNSFSIPLTSPDIPSAAETGSATVNGTIFQFDPGIQYVGTATDPIFGNSTGGTLTQPGNLGAGQRMAVVMFETRNDAITGCSAPVTFFLTEGANSLVCTNLPTGPPNVTKRIVAFTGANGDFFFYIPQPVTVTDNGVKTTYTSTVVNDNISTQATFTFTDAVLLAATSIDTEGSDNFEQIELGSCLGFVAYSSRLFAWGEQNKIQNLINISFDGGYLPNPGSPLVPLGWTVDGTFGVGGTLTASPLFGNAYYIQNATGGTVAGAYGMIEQTAFQDYFLQPIINTNTQYGVRVTASCPGGVPGAGNLVIDLFSPGFNLVYGSFTVPLASMTPAMAIFTGDLLLTEFFSSVPSDLLYRIYATDLPNLGDVLIDRTEPFDLSQPVLTTQLRGSYENNFEAFDDVTGNLGVAIQNQQPVMDAFELFDNLYLVRNGSFASTTDNGVTEPDLWKVKEISNKCGTPSIHGVDVGESWAIIAGEPGIYIFEGGKPQKVSPEIDPLWRAVNWKYGYTLWLKNDTDNRRLSIGLPLPTPNQWMPQFPVNANPTQPNVVLICNYKELMTAGAIAGEGAIRQGYTGILRAFQFGRRWSVWSIEAAYADFIKRPDTTTPLFYLDDTGPGIFQQVAGSYVDDGEPLLWRYTTYPFLKSEDAQAIHAGLHNLLCTYGTATIIGDGELQLTILPDTLDTPYGDALLPLPLLNPPPYGDTEFPLDSVGNRFFADFQPYTTGSWMELSRMVLTVKQNPWAPVGATGNVY